MIVILQTIEVQSFPPIPNTSEFQSTITNNTTERPSLDNINFREAIVQMVDDMEYRKHAFEEDVVNFFRQSKNCTWRKNHHKTDVLYMNINKAAMSEIHSMLGWFPFFLDGAKIFNEFGYRLLSHHEGHNLQPWSIYTFYHPYAMNGLTNDCTEIIESDYIKIIEGVTDLVDSLKLRKERLAYNFIGYSWKNVHIRNSHTFSMLFPDMLWFSKLMTDMGNSLIDRLNSIVFKYTDKKFTD